MHGFEDKIHQLILPLCREEHIYLNSVSVAGGGKHTIIRVIVDTDNGITLGECQVLSQKISDIFYRRDIFKGAYRLEVSSPGINKPLEHDFEYKRNIGKQIKVNYMSKEGQKTVLGELLAFDDRYIKLRSDEGDLDIPRNDINLAKIKLKW